MAAYCPDHPETKLVCPRCLAARPRPAKTPALAKERRARMKILAHMPRKKKRRKK